MIPLIPEYCPTQRLLHLGHDAASHRASLRQDGACRSGTWRRPPQLHPIDCLALAGPLYYHDFDMSVPKAVFGDDSTHRFRPIRFTRNEMGLRRGEQTTVHAQRRGSPSARKHGLEIFLGSLRRSYSRSTCSPASTKSSWALGFTRSNGQKPQPDWRHGIV